MSENSDTSRNVSNDEIDLLELFRRMGKTLGNWLRAIGRAFMVSLVFLLRRWLPLGLSLIAGIGISYFLKSTSTSFYTSDLVLKNNLYENKESGTTSEMIAIVNKLQVYCREGNHSELEQLLSEPAEAIDNINSISAYWIIDKNKNGIPDYVDYQNKHDVYDTTDIRMQDRFDIRVIIKSPQALTKLRRDIVNYIEHDSLFQLRNEIRIQQDKALLDRYNYDISQLDSLQKVKYFEETRNIAPKSGGQIIFMQEQKTQLVYSDIYSLYAKKQKIETDLALYKNIVTVLSDFSLPAIRENGTKYYAKTIVPLIFGLTLIVLILIANKTRIIEIFEKY
ncbi:MAG TPA: hypothetical protein VJ963_02210 [Bacteroidales bacterium]|nr:hypothetical protein [Bacteroidales bacterium]